MLPASNSLLWRSDWAIRIAWIARSVEAEGKGELMPRIHNPANPGAPTSISSSWFPARTTALGTLAKTFFLVMVCAHFAFRYVSNPSFLNLSVYTQGLERTPYQYRVLPMYVFRVMMRSGLIVRLASHQRFLNDDPHLLIFMGLALVSLIGAMLVTRLTISRLTGDSGFAFWAVFMIALMCDLQLASPGAFILPYDVPSLFFFATGMYLTISRRFIGYYLLFPLAVLNRETACFISVFFVVWEWVRLSKQGVEIKSRILRLSPHALAQAAICVAIKIYLAKAYAHNPAEVGSTSGGLFVSKLHYNLHELLKPEQWPYLLSICGFSLPFLYLQRRWIRCDGIRYACAIVLPIYFMGMMLVGVIVELRIFTEWLALITPAIALILHNRFAPAPHGPGQQGESLET